MPPRALLTLPTNLRMETLVDGTKTVIAEKIFRKGTQFGKIFCLFYTTIFCLLRSIELCQGLLKQNACMQ